MEANFHVLRLIKFQAETQALTVLSLNVFKSYFPVIKQSKIYNEALP